MNRLLKPAFAFYALAKIVLLAAFVLSVGKAASATDTATNLSCEGKDLIAEMANDAPQKLAALRTEANETINGNGRLWKISREGLADSYLFGTMHMADNRIATLPQNALSAYKSAKIVAIENIEALDPAKMQSVLVELKELTLILDGTTVENLLDPPTIVRLKEMADAHGMPYQVAQRLQPWLLASMAALPPCELARKNAGEPVLDKVIGELAVKDGKQLIGLETIKEQFTAIASLPKDFHATALTQTLALGGSMQDAMHTMKNLYLSGEIGLIIPFMRQYSPEASQSDALAQFRENMIHKRNHTMARRAGDLLSNGNLFMAVGALHLPGEQGIVALIQEAGYTVTPVK